MPQFSQTCPITQELTINAYDVDEDHRQEKEKRQEEVKRVRKHMERCLHDFKVVRHLRISYIIREDLRTSMLITAL